MTSLWKEGKSKQAAKSPFKETMRQAFDKFAITIRTLFPDNLLIKSPILTCIGAEGWLACAV